MRNAASHTIQIFTAITAILTVLAVTVVSSVNAYTIDPNHTYNGSPKNQVSGTISVNGITAKAVIVNDSNTEMSGGFASYKKVDEVIENQTLYQSKTWTLKANSTTTLTIDLPCWAQVDLFNGPVLNDFKTDRYSPRLLYAVHTQQECSTPTPTIKPTSTPTAKPTSTPTVKTTGTPTVKPTSTPTVAPTSTPSVQPTNSPSPTPVITAVATSTPTPSSSPSTPNTPSNNGDGLGCATHDCSGTPVHQGEVAGAYTTQQLPSTGNGFNQTVILGWTVFIIGVKLLLVAKSKETQL